MYNPEDAPIGDIKHCDLSSFSPKETTELDQQVTAGTFALEIMHELRNPLETLINLNYLILNVSDNLDQAKEYARLGEEQLETLSRITRQSLGFARLSEGRKPFDLVDLAEAALRIHQRTVETKRIHLVKRFPSDLIAEVQQGQLLQVVSNLIGNALEALSEEGQLTLCLKRRENAIDIVVGDNGPGIPHTDCERLFEPYFTTKGAEGNGLGLSLSKRIVDDHGGKIVFRTSCTAGRCGTVFRVRLPLAK